MLSSDMIYDIFLKMSTFHKIQYELSCLSESETVVGGDKMARCRRQSPQNKDQVNDKMIRVVQCISVTETVPNAILWCSKHG